MADQELERYVLQMRWQLERMPISRRGFMWAGAMSATAAFLAACNSGGGTATAASDADGADVGAVDGAALDGAAVAAPPPLLQAARKAAVADMALAHMKPRRLIGIRSNCQRI